MSDNIIWKTPRGTLYITEHYPEECLNPQYNLYIKRLLWWDGLLLFTRHEDGLSELKDVAYLYEGHV